MAGENGLVGNITLPTKEELADYDTFEIDFSLGCDGPLDKDCPYWDHTVQLYVCCSNPDGPQKPCEKCGPTVWGSIESNHRPSESPKSIQMHFSICSFNCPCHSPLRPGEIYKSVFILHIRT
jgi:hypothetical protein